MMNDETIARLEKWNSGHKARFVRIGIENGYGATCWQVTLKGEGGLQVKSFEYCGNQTVHQVSVITDDSEECNWEWPGLAATINAAIDRWEELSK